jgi:hypothetical protein
VRWPSEWTIPCRKSSDFPSLTLRMKPSMNTVYKLVRSRYPPPRTASEGRRAVAKSTLRFRQRNTTNTHVGCTMRILIGNGHGTL